MCVVHGIQYHCTEALDVHFEIWNRIYKSICLLSVLLQQCILKYKLTKDTMISGMIFCM